MNINIATSTKKARKQQRAIPIPLNLLCLLEVMPVGIANNVITTQAQGEAVQYQMSKRYSGSLGLVA